jgi:autotransporter-associated beta strand protein
MNLKNYSQVHRLTAIATFAALSLAGWSSDAKAQTKYWNTNGLSSTWTALNWGTTDAGPFDTAWVASSDVVFGGSVPALATFATTTVGNITVSTDTTVTQAGTLSFKSGGSTVDVAAGKTLTWTGQGWSTGVNQIVTKSGSGTWNYGSQGTALGAGSSFTLNGGTLIVTNGVNSFGGANTVLNINGGTINASGSTRTYANSAINIGGDFENSGAGNGTWSGTVSLGDATRTINSTGSGKRAFTGVISGGAGAGLTITGAGTGETFIGNTNNTFSGPVTIRSGKAVFNGGGAFGTTTSITLEQKVTFAGNDSGTAAVTSTLAVDKSIFLGDSAGVGVASNGIITINGVIADKLDFSGSLTKSDTGTLILGGQSTYTGRTTVNNGMLKLADGENRLPTGTLLKLGAAGNSGAVGTTATFDLNGQNQQINGLESTTSTLNQNTTNTVTSASAATLTIGASSGVTTTFGSGTVKNRGVITGDLAVTKTGGGTQVLGGANTYTGTTRINAGTLVVDGSLLSSGTVLVNDGGSLSGSGSVGAVTLGSGSFLKPGNSPGTLTADSSIWQAGSTYSWETLSIPSAGKVAGTDWDLFSVTGALDMSALNSSSASTKMNLVLNSLSLASFDTSAPYTWVIAKAGSLTGYAADNTNLTDLFNIDTANFNGGLPANLPTGGFQVVTGTDGSLRTLNLVAIPEPSTGSLLGFGLGGLVLTRLLRRKQS